MSKPTIITFSKTPGELFKIDGRLSVKGPVFDLNGKRTGAFVFDREYSKKTLTNGVTETSLEYKTKANAFLTLDVVIRKHPATGIIRFSYTLSSSRPVSLTKIKDCDAIDYFSFRTPKTDFLTEIQFSHFNEITHAYEPVVVTNKVPKTKMTYPGPIVILHSDNYSFMAGYEHGTEYPDSYLTLDYKDDTLSVKAKKGNYHNGKQLPFRSVWFEISCVPLNLANFMKTYRAFIKNEITENTESRKPYIFYNTWNNQERFAHLNGKSAMDPISNSYLLKEIEVAKKIGIEYFVIDAGWQDHCGSWNVNSKRITDNLAKVKKTIDSNGMKMGLWFFPPAVSMETEVYKKHPEWQMLIDGKPRIFKTGNNENSVLMCLESGFSDYFIKRMIDLNKELGVTYYKWDGMDGWWFCDSPEHGHGTRANSSKERKECYYYCMSNQMVRMAAEITKVCPDTIIDFDISEPTRSVGLGFLSAGKYFLFNNGPYYANFDLPAADVTYKCLNVFFYPGAMRPRICRGSYKYDTIAPSNLFLSHFFPDSPLVSQQNSMASLMLGGNGIWGDLLALKKTDIKYLADQLKEYKKVRVEVTESYPLVTGFSGSSPEIHEKFDPKKATGMVVFFTKNAGNFSYLTQPLVKRHVNGVKGADKWEFTSDNRLKLSVKLGKDEARTVFIG